VLETQPCPAAVIAWIFMLGGIEVRLDVLRHRARPPQFPRRDDVRKKMFPKAARASKELDDRVRDKMGKRFAKGF